MPQYQYRTLRGGLYWDDLGNPRLEVSDSGSAEPIRFSHQDVEGAPRLIARDDSAFLEYLNHLGDEGWQVVLGRGFGADADGDFVQTTFLMVRNK